MAQGNLNFTTEVGYTSIFTGSLFDVNGNPAVLTNGDKIGFKFGAGASVYLNFDSSANTAGGSSLSITSYNPATYKLTLNANDTGNFPPGIFRVELTWTDSTQSNTLKLIDYGQIIVQAALTSSFPSLPNGPMAYKKVPSQAPMFLGTYSDLIDHVTLFSGASNQASTQFLIRRAIENAYRDMTQSREWKYYLADERIVTNPPYMTGTVQYTNATNQMVLSGGTWPSWVVNGRFLIGTTISEVDTQLSSTTIVLDPVMNPGSDLAAGTSFTLYRNLYDLPTDFRSLRGAVTTRNYPLTQISPIYFMNLERRMRGQGQPIFYSLWPDVNLFNQMCFAVYPAPDSNYIIDIPYQRYARPLLHSGYGPNDQAGTVTVNGQIVTGTGTNFTQDMTGSVFRVGTSSSAPTGTVGTNPYQEQQTIMAVNSTAQLTLNQALNRNYGSSDYSISDPIDMPQYMYSALLRKCEYDVLSLLRQPTADLERRAQMAMTLALEGDNQVLDDRNSPGAKSFSWWHFSDPLGQQG